MKAPEGRVIVIEEQEQFVTKGGLHISGTFKDYSSGIVHDGENFSRGSRVFYRKKSGVELPEVRGLKLRSIDKKDVLAVEDK